MDCKKRPKWKTESEIRYVKFKLKPNQSTIAFVRANCYYAIILKSERTTTTAILHCVCVCVSWVMTSENELGDNLIANVKSDVHHRFQWYCSTQQLYKLLFQCSMVSWHRNAGPLCFILLLFSESNFSIFHFHFHFFFSEIQTTAQFNPNVL